MKKTIILAGSVAAFALMAFAGRKPYIDVYKVDTKNSSLEWYAEKVAGKHNGIIMLSGGEIKNDHENLTGTFEIDMTTIENKDQSGEWKTKLEGHLKSADFFDVTKYPKATFAMTSATALKDAKEGGFTHTVKGNLTIKDKTNEITFDAVLKMEGEKIACVGTATVDRSKFDVKYGSKSFFPEIGDKMIYDEFKLKFSVVAVK